VGEQVSRLRLSEIARDPMNSNDTIAAEPLPCRTAHITTYAFCLIFSAIIAIALARAAVWLQLAGFSTAFIFPAIFGAALGFGTWFLARQFGCDVRGAVLLAALCGAVIMAAAEHGFFYLEYRHRFESKLHSNPQGELLASMSPNPPMPATFFEFMAAEAPAKWPLWIFDAVTMIVIAALVAWWMSPNTRLSARG
jgi:hypothetical protein